MIAPILYQKLALVYFQEKSFKTNRIHKEVASEIFKKLNLGLELAENPKIEQYAKEIESARREEITQRVANALQHLSFSEKKILEMAFGLKTTDNRNA